MSDFEALIAEQEARRDEAWALFNRFDHDGSGSIDADELAQLLTLMNPDAANIAIDLGQTDQDGDGVLSFEEFVVYHNGLRDRLREEKSRRARCADAGTQTLSSSIASSSQQVAGPRTTPRPAPGVGQAGHCPPDVVRLVDVVAERAQKDGLINPDVLNAWSSSLDVKYGDLVKVAPPPERLGIPMVQRGAARELARARATPVLPPPSGKVPEAQRLAVRKKYGDLTLVTAPPEQLGIPLILECARREFEAWAAKRDSSSGGSGS